MTRRFSRLATPSRVVPLLLALTSTACLPRFDPFHIDLPDSSIANPTDAEARSCDAVSDVPTPESIGAASLTLDDWSDGVVDVNLSPNGCHRYQREIRDGVLVHSAFVVQVGVAFTGDRLAPIIATIAEWNRGPDGVLRGGIDADEMPDDPEDTYFEQREMQDPNTQRFERTWWNEASDTMTERLTISVEDDGRVRQVREELVDGVLTTVEDFYAGPESMADPDVPVPGPIVPIGGCAPIPCTAEDTMRLDRIYREQRESAFSCFSRNGMDRGNSRARSFATLAVGWNTAHEWVCLPESCENAGQWCATCQARGGPLRMSIKLAGHDDTEIGATIVHELSHGILGGHPPQSQPLIDGDAGTSGTVIDNRADDTTLARISYMLRYTDPTYACEAYCAPSGSTERTYRNACSCAACLGVRPCDPPCNNLPSCTVRNSHGEAIASEAIGTVCVETHILDPDEYSWFSELSTCMEPGACSGECQSQAPPNPCTPDCH